MHARSAQPATPAFARNALAPAIIAAAVLVYGSAIVGNDWFTLILYVVAILALIVAWFAVRARQWWWVPVFVAVAVLWNPMYPLPFESVWWVAAQPVAAVVFLVAGVLIKEERRPAR